MSHVFGIDVSHYQGKIDWKKVAADSKKFCIMKCQYEAQSHRIDETFERNYMHCGLYGISRGVYIFVGSKSIADPVGDAKALLGHLNGRHLEYGIWLDYESESLRALGKNRIKQITEIYADLFKNAGYYVGIYCNKSWYENLIHKDLKKDFDFWIARYPKNDIGEYHSTSNLKPSYSQAVAWQYSSKGHVNGITGNVDLDVDFDGIVNLIAKDSHRKSDREIAEEVIKGLWGTKNTKPTRKELLSRAGYDYDSIQKIVNEIIYK